MATTRRPLAEQQAAIDTRRALELAVREHERQRALEEEAAIRQAMGAREQARPYRAPMRDASAGDPRVIQGLAQPGQLHQQDPRMYRQQVAQALTPAQQEALDAQHDYQRNWMARDEAGNLRLQRRPLSDLGMEPAPVAIEREMQRFEQADRVPKPSRPAKPMKQRA